MRIKNINPLGDVVDLLIGREVAAGEVVEVSDEAAEDRIATGNYEAAEDRIATGNSEAAEATEKKKG